MRTIQIYEYDKLVIGKKYGEVEFLKRHCDALYKCFDSQSEENAFFTLINRGVQFKQFVGVICVGDLQIEVLPKADKIDGGDSFWRDKLLDMLKTVYHLKVHSPSSSHDNLRKSDILDIFLQRFMDEAEKILHIGLVKTYRQIDENCNALKGKLLFGKNISKNCVHKERFYVRHTIYDYNHICNQIIVKVLRMIPDISRNSYTRHRAQTILFEFPEMLDITADAATFAKMQYNRKTEDYRMAMDIARLILLHYMPMMNSKNAREHVLALMFDMNKLWEEYVYVILKKQLSGYSVSAQCIKTFWKSADVGNKIIKPDIVIMKDGKCVAILDTKWKIPKDDKPSDADLKQMYVYHHLWETDKTMLIYPGNEERIIEGRFAKNTLFNEGNTELKCSMLFLPIENKDNQIKTNVSHDFNKSISQDNTQENRLLNLLFQDVSQD